MLVKSLKFLLEFGLFFGGLLLFPHGICALLLHELPLVHHLMIGFLVVLRLLFVVIVSVASHGAGVVLGRVLALVVVSRSAHHANVLSNVLLADEVAHVVLVGHIFVLVLMLLALLDLGQLATGQTCDFTEHLGDAAPLCRDLQASKLLLHFGSDALCPPSDLIIDQLHVLLALCEALHFTLQLLAFVLEVGVFRLLSLHIVGGAHQHFHLILIRLVGILVIGVRLVDLSAVLIGNLQLTDPLLFRRVLGLQGVVLSLILADCEQKRCISLLLSHKLLNNFSDI